MFFFLKLYMVSTITENTLNEVTPEACWTWEFADDLSHIYALTPPDFAGDPQVLIQEHK